MSIIALRKNHPNLSSNAILLYLIILERLKDSGKDFLYYTNRQMSEDTGLTDRCCRSLLGALIDEGLIRMRKSGKVCCYSLPEDPDPDPAPKRRKRKPEKFSGTAQSPNKINNIVSISCMESDISDNPTQDIDNDPFSDYSIDDLPAEAVSVVRREYDRLRTWYGRQPIRIGGVMRRPADVRRRMRELTAEHIAQVVRAYAEGWIHSAVCGIQTALFNAPQFRLYAVPDAVAVGQTPPAEPPAPEPAPEQPAPKPQPPKRRNAFCSFEQRTYDYDALERAFEQQLLAAQRG